jgi:putative transposase
VIVSHQFFVTTGALPGQLAAQCAHPQQLIALSNAHAERFVRTLRTECLNQFVIFGERHLRHVLREFSEHYLTERHHQGIGGRIIQPKAWPSNDNGKLGGIERRSRLGGLLNSYRRAA